MHINTHKYTYSQFSIFGSFVFVRGGDNNAQPAKSYFRFVQFGAGTFWEWPVSEMPFLTTITSLIPKFKIQESGRAGGRIFNFELC